MKVGFVSLGMGAAPFEEVLQVAAATGCEAMELNGRSTVHQGLWTPPVDCARLKAQVATQCLAVTSLGGYSNFSQPTDEGLAAQVEELVGYCQTARAMGIHIVRAFSGDVIEGHTLDELYPRIVAGFKAVVERISTLGVAIGIENHGRLMNNGDALKALVDDIGSPLVGITLDTGNFCWAGHPIATAQRFFEQLAPLTINVHVKDGGFRNGEWTLTPAGRGDLDIPGLLHALAVSGYRGPILSEYEGQANFVTSTLESVAYLRGLRDGIS